MHEVSICRNILKIVVRAQQQHHFNSVHTIYFERGLLTCIDKDALLFSFAAVKQNPLFANAHLEIIDVPGRAYCQSCDCEFNIEQYYHPCPYCEGYKIAIIDGEQMIIKDLGVS